MLAKNIPPCHKSVHCDRSTYSSFSLRCQHALLAFLLVQVQMQVHREEAGKDHLVGRQEAKGELQMDGSLEGWLKFSLIL